jgi:NAD-dependent SIR2 family protein deacetylase
MVHKPAVTVTSDDDLESWLGFFRAGNVVVLGGAGVSTDSGIPDYRDDQGRFKHGKPIDFRDFSAAIEVRRRYWARSMVGYSRVKHAEPNAAHVALCRLERQGAVDLVITQNVDGLHQRAGSRNVLDLHGRLDRVLCLGCGAMLTRDAMQRRLFDENPDWVARAAEPHGVAPDGDAIVVEPDVRDLRVPSCVRCGGVLKPDVVFFGEHVPSERGALAAAAVEQARSLLVVGSSLMVFSGYRFVRQANRLGLPVLVINRGITRADDVASLRAHGNVGAVLSRLSTALGPA